MARELYIGGDGLKIARMGFDATTATGADLLFDSNSKFLMQIDSGSFTLGTTSRRINFSTPFVLSEPPAVLCYGADAGSIGYPVRITPDTTGFDVLALTVYDGTQPAANKAMAWVAFLMGLP